MSILKFVIFMELYPIMNGNKEKLKKVLECWKKLSKSRMKHKEKIKRNLVSGIMLLETDS